ncbi:glutathione S-transferase 1 [Eurytemora carolleeae]|uniref:glutathione S-transferase 1 n=1 Tax=Eurytemora carolleeae TaxID=1294199 RepID=UPI000C765852|nr:glutathione S-transferase 1 [Eurytemora carolleeae]|eukprot:XP_023324653.1 glutathione S-transferase 1-like [Eurytemora affinis]
MPAIKLTYFDLRARAEPARLILAQAGAKFEDIRIPAPWDDMEGWQKMKPTTPYGQIPLLEVDGEVISESVAIARYCAREFGLAGKTTFESAQADEIVDAVQGAIEKQYVAYLFEKDEARKTDLQKAFNESVLPTLLGNLEKRLCSRGGDFFVGGALTWADIVTYQFCVELPDKTVVEKYPKISALVAKVGELPNIKAWVASRPKTTL